jgi:hypothetical protein
MGVRGQRPRFFFFFSGRHIFVGPTYFRDDIFPGRHITGTTYFQDHMILGDFFGTWFFAYILWRKGYVVA